MLAKITITRRRQRPGRQPQPAGACGESGHARQRPQVPTLDSEYAEGGT